MGLFIDKRQNLDGWYKTSEGTWRARKTISIAGLADSALTNFPLNILISNDANLAQYARDDGRDVVFTKTDGTKLSHVRGDFAKLLVTNGAWTVHNRFEAIHYKGTNDRTYVLWVNSPGNMMIGQYDHTSKIWTEFTLKSAYEVDDHSNPTLTILNDGTLVTLYSEHAGATAFYRKSTNPEDISAWGAETALGLDTQYTYVRPYKMGSRVYILWRGALVAGARDTKMTWTDDNFATFASAVNLVSVASSDPYVHASVDVENSKIYIAFHPDNLESAGAGVSDIYTGVITNTAGVNSYSDMAGGAVTLPFGIANSTKAYDSVASNDKGQIINIHHNHGLPRILFGKYVSDQEQRLFYGRWTGSAWVNTEIINMGEGIGGSSTQGHYTGSAYMDTIDPHTIYYSAVSNAKHTIFKAYTSDNGTTWIATAISTGGKNFRPIVPQNRHNTEMQCLWLHGAYVVYTNFFTAIQAYPAINNYANAQFAVKLPTVDNNLSQIYMYYGNENASEQQDTYANVFGANALYNLIGDSSYTAKGIVDLRSLTGMTIEVGFYMQSSVLGNDEYLTSNFHASLNQAMVMFRKVASSTGLMGAVRMTTGSSVTATFTDLVPSVPNRHGAILQFDQAGDGKLEGFMDGTKSTISGNATNAIHATLATNQLYTAVSPHALTKFLQGYVDWIVFYNIAQNDAWCKARTRNLGLQSTYITLGTDVLLEDFVS